MYGWTKKYQAVTYKDLADVFNDLLKHSEPTDRIVYFKIIVRKSNMYQEMKSNDLSNTSNE